ncbi:MAG: SUMF1/EgtB/PvdO family nonheme iron enzyme [Burkholderiaceae bacterium]
MSEPTENPPNAPTAATLAAALRDSRRRTLALFQRLQAAIGAEALPRYLPELSPPLWDLGHLAWYEGWWTSRNPGLMAGDGANPATARAPSGLLPQADAWFDDRRVNQPARWHQPLPPAAVVADWARRTREHSLALLPAASRRPAALALFARVLDAEDRLHEDWLSIAQTLGIAPGDAADDPAPAAGAAAGDAPLAIDLAPVSWARFLPFVDAGGYEERSFWSDEGWEWRKRQGLLRPRHVAEPGEPGTPPRRARFGQWVPLDPAQPAMHLSAHEARAWCRWAGRRLPTAAEWRAAQVGAPGFAWGEVWEWVQGDECDECDDRDDRTEGDAAGAAPLLVGVSFATAARLRGQPGLRRQPAERNDGFSGFRSAAAAA